MTQSVTSHRLGRILLSAVAAGAIWLGQPVGARAQAKKITFVTDTTFNGRHALFYVALEKGYFREEGIDIDIRAGKGSGVTVKEIAAGAADAGFADAGVLVLARGNEGVPVKLLSVIYADCPLGYITMKDTGINSPKDLEGKTIAESVGGATALLFPAYAQHTGIDPKKITVISADSNAMVGLLLSGQAAGVSQFLVGLPLFAKRAAPRPVQILAFRDAGIHYYSNGIIMREDKIAADPALAKGIVRAVQRGMQAAFANPKEAGQILAKYQRQIEPDVGQGETELVRDLAKQPDEARLGLGYLDRVKVQETIDVISKYFDLKKAVTIDEVIAPGFVAPFS